MNRWCVRTYYYYSSRVLTKVEEHVGHVLVRSKNSKTAIQYLRVKLTGVLTGMISRHVRTLTQIYIALMIPHEAPRDQMARINFEAHGPEKRASSGCRVLVT